MAIILEYIILGHAHLMIACTSAFGIGAYWFAISIIKNIQRILHSINSKAHAKKIHSNGELMALCSEFIDTHAATS